MQQRPSTEPSHCALCGRAVLDTGARLVELRRSLKQSVLSRHPELAPNAVLCRACLNDERTGQLLTALEQDRGELSSLEREVSRKAALHAISAEHIGERFDRATTRGERIADRVAKVGGSWPFVVSFCVLLGAWIMLNSLLLGRRAFDPYPYILLNLALSCLAALQAPVIMMSQNRAAARDRLEADEDFKVNLKAELEVAALHEKLDHLLHVQWQRMLEIQQAQLDLLEQLTRQGSDE